MTNLIKAVFTDLGSPVSAKFENEGFGSGSGGVSNTSSNFPETVKMRFLAIFPGFMLRKVLLYEIKKFFTLRKLRNKYQLNFQVI